MHLVGFSVEIYYDARLYERQINKSIFTNYLFLNSAKVSYAINN